MSTITTKPETLLRDVISTVKGLVLKFQSLWQTEHELVWKDNIAPMIAGKGIELAEPDLVNLTGGLWALGFSNTVVEEVMCFFHIDHDYARGTKVYPHVHWATSNTNTGVVRWGIEYTVVARDGGAFPASTTFYVEQAGDGTILSHIVTEATDSDAFVIPEPAVDSIVMMRVFRDATHANDTYNADAYGVFVDLHYQADRSGTPQKADNFYER